MGERKVLNKYIPPDFDPSLIPRFKRDKHKLVEVRMMIPFNMRCNTCGEFMYRGKKFNSKKEDVVGDDYLGIRKFRFIIKCSHCNAEISFKTDPEKGDYECESGASRNFEVWRQAEEVESAVAKKREEEEKVDAMRALENRTIDSKWEMEVLDQLDEIRAMQQRHEKVDHDAVLKKIEQKHSGLAPHGPEQEVDEIEAFREAKSRLLDDDDEDITLPTTKKSSDAKPVKPAPSTAATGAVTFQIVTKKRVAGPSVRQSKKKRKLDPDPVPATEQKAPPPPPPPATASVLGALASYGECSSDEA